MRDHAFGGQDGVDESRVVDGNDAQVQCTSFRVSHTKRPWCRGAPGRSSLASSPRAKGGGGCARVIRCGAGRGRTSGAVLLCRREIGVNNGAEKARS